MKIDNEKILVEQDDELLDSILTDLSQYRKSFEKVVETYKALNVGEMTEEVYDQIRNDHAGDVVDLYNKKLQDELDGAKFSNSTLRASLLAGTTEPPKAFLKAVREFANTEVKVNSYKRRELGSEVRLTIDDISFRDGILYISDSDREAITEKHCRFYLETQDEKEIYEAVKTIAGQYKILMEKDKALGMNLNRSYLNSIQGFFIDVGETISPNKRYIAGLSARMKRLNKYR